MHYSWVLMEDLVPLEQLARSKHLIIHETDFRLHDTTINAIIGTADNPHEREQTYTVPVIDEDKERSLPTGTYCITAKNNHYIITKEKDITKHHLIYGITKENALLHQPERYNTILNYLSQARALTE